ncbi:dolichyl-diphosphooligosaccharide-protein glycotransferase TDEL_0F01350 [Torulaspora delbrueckii]|uniref:Dolichyl-diphosphooligosaccharide--protein glycosyltransferase subunit OST2 n=1 Tax=Torulaspora delbrueckii TaxID=4950 RepID=G8ZWF2_TORDE|nr:hypothetical protein TDEL_0F01350 [Torulaspora delbrueckii]CCE92946.1 hypothetical protein TDEL_0F01350 [Torulaspora delbrueckii]
MSPKVKKAAVAAQTGSGTLKSKIPSSGTISKDFSDAFNVSLESYLSQVKKDNRLKLIDIFCVFLVAIALVQTVFMAMIRDTFPFNAFLAGFIVCVGQFVLLISLRLQIVDSFPGISKNRAFGEFVLASLVLHFISLHFIN